MATNKDKQSGGGLGLATALIGAAAAGFYLYGPKGVENRKKIRGWTLKAKGEVLEKIEKSKEVSDDSYVEIVDKVTAKYAKLKDVGEDEATKLNKELKRHWKSIKKAAAEKEPTKKRAAKKADK